MILCLAANPAVDKTFLVERLTVDSIHRPRGFMQLPGGKGLNVARALRSLGSEVTAVTILGGGTGRWIDDTLKVESIPALAAWTDTETRSCLSVSDQTTGTLTEFYEDPLPIDEDVWERFIALVHGELHRVIWMTISGSLPEGAPEDGYADLIERARQARVRVAVDTRGPFLENCLDARPDLVKINNHEAAEVLGRDVVSETQVIQACRELGERTGGAVVITRSRRGAVGIDSDGTGWSGVVDASRRYAVGSGDCFLAGFVRALERGQSFEEAMKAALGAAVANAEQPGAGRLSVPAAAAFAREARLLHVGLPHSEDSDRWIILEEGQDPEEVIGRSATTPGPVAEFAELEEITLDEPVSEEAAERPEVSLVEDPAPDPDRGHDHISLVDLPEDDESPSASASWTWLH